MSALRIFSYLPNPRIWKATIAARLCGVEVELRGAPPDELSDWLWDFDAAPLDAERRRSAAGLGREANTGFGGRLYKTEAFLAAHPFGTVPAAFSPDGAVGVFESNSIMRAVARLGEGRCPLYGHDAYSAARIDGFLDASLIFARDVQIYILALRAGEAEPRVHAAAGAALGSYLSGIERALENGQGYIAVDRLSLADICFVAELALLHNERVHERLLHEQGLDPHLSQAIESDFPRSFAHFKALCCHEAFAPDVEPYLGRLNLLLTPSIPPR